MGRDIPIVVEVRGADHRRTHDGRGNGERIAHHALLANRSQDSWGYPGKKRPGYGEEILQTLSAKLS